MQRFSPYGNRSNVVGSGYGGGFGQPGSSMLFGNSPPSNFQKDTQTCTAHGKRRTVKNMVQNDDGKWVCSSSSQCKVTIVSNTTTNGEAAHATCIIHKKKRTIANMEKKGNGDWVCLKSSRCKSGGYGEINGRFNHSIYQASGGYGLYLGSQQGGWPSMNPGYGGGYSRGLICIVHGKKRTQQNLVRNQRGNWVCSPGSRCKMMAGQKLVNGNEIKICSTHGKQRSSANMKQGEDGEWVCSEGNKCKVVPEGAKTAGEQTCSVHNKSRSLPNLEQNANGDWVCTSDSTCK